MARITVEDCLEKLDNRFALIHLAAKRVRQIRRGEEPLVRCKNKDIVTALREIAAGEVFQTESPPEREAIEGEKELTVEGLPEPDQDGLKTEEPEEA